MAGVLGEGRLARSLEVASLAPERLPHAVLLEEVHLERHLAADALLLAHRAEHGAAAAAAAAGPARLLLGARVRVPHVLAQLRRAKLNGKSLLKFSNATCG